GQVDFERGARTLLDAGARLVVRTEGADGATFATVRSRGHVPAFAIDAVDTLGAGDAFVAGLIRALGCWRLAHRGLDALTGSDLVEVSRGAHAAAALATRKRGAMAGLPTGAEVEGFLVGQERRGRSGRKGI